MALPHLISFRPRLGTPGSAIAQDRVAAVGELVIVKPVPGDLPTLRVKPPVFFHVLRHKRLPARRITAEDGGGHGPGHAVALGIVVGGRRAQFAGGRRHGLDGVAVPIARSHEIVEISLSRIGDLAATLGILGRKYRKLLLVGLERRVLVPVRPLRLGHLLLDLKPGQAWELSRRSAAHRRSRPWSLAWAGSLRATQEGHHP